MCEYVEKKGGMSVVTSEVISAEFAGKDTAQCQSGHDKLQVWLQNWVWLLHLMTAYKFFANLNAGAS